MSLRIQNNVEAFNAHRRLTATNEHMSKSMERLASGYRINRSADDAAGLAISENLRGQVRGLAQAQRNTLDAVSMVQVGEAALVEVHTMLQRVRELAVQFKNGSLSTEDRAAITEIDPATTGVSTVRAQLGAVQNRLDHTLASAQTYEENLTAAESRIRDADMAKEMTHFTKWQILQQAGTAMLAQANQSNQAVLQLLG